MRLDVACGVALVLAAAPSAAAANAPAYPWEQPTEVEAACLYMQPPAQDSLTPPEMRLLLADRIPKRIPLNIPDAYAASTILPSGTYCLALWTSSVVSGQQCRFTFDWRGILCARVLAHDGVITKPPTPEGRTRVELDRRPVFIECSRNPSLWLTSSLFWATLPYELGARVMLDQGSILVGITNYLSRSIEGTVRIVHGDGVRTLVSSFPFRAPARGVMLQHLPVREATMDEPFIETMVMLQGAHRGHVRALRTQCRSGALFRNPELGRVVGPLPACARVRIADMPRGGMAVSLNGGTLVKRMWFEFPGAEVQWAGTAIDTTGTATIAGARVAALSRMLRANDRGDAQVFVGCDMLADGPVNQEQPRMLIDLAWGAVSNGLVMAKIRNKYVSGMLDAAHAAETLSRLSGPGVDEWSLVLARDWLTFNLDSARIEVMRAGAQPDADLRLIIRSRTAWQSPAPRGRAGNIQFFVHFPVAQ